MASEFLLICFSLSSEVSPYREGVGSTDIRLGSWAVTLTLTLVADVVTLEALSKPCWLEERPYGVIIELIN